jgi:uncharacterized protein with GYD domain
MTKYLWHCSYTTNGVKGVLAEGGTGRRQAVEKLIAGAGGFLEAFYYAFGEDDVYCIVELPDNVSAAAISMAIAATGSVRVKTTVLLTPEEIDRAVQTSVDYRPPGT